MDSMENQTFINYLILIGSGILGWLWKTLWNAVERLKSDLKDLEVKLPETYAQKVDAKADRHGRD